MVSSLLLGYVFQILFYGVVHQCGFTRPSSFYFSAVIVRDIVPLFITYSLHLKRSCFLLLLGSGPNGVDDLCFHTYGEYSPSPSSLEAGFQTLALGFGP